MHSKIPMNIIIIPKNGVRISESSDKWGSDNWGSTVLDKIQDTLLARYILKFACVLDLLVA